MKPARIDTVPGLKEKVAEAYAEGCTQKEIAQLAGVNDRGTVAEWLKRSDVQSMISKAVEERANKILRHTDTAIEKKLTSGKEQSLETLLKVRQTFAGQKVNLDVGGEKSKLLENWMRELDENPDLAAAFEAATKSGDEPE